MKTFEETRGKETEDLNESRLLRKGSALLLARSAKKHGDDATRSLTDAKHKVKGSPLDSDEERLKSIQDGLQCLCDGLISIRKQNGAVTGIVLTAVSECLTEFESHLFQISICIFMPTFHIGCEFHRITSIFVDGKVTIKPTITVYKNGD